MQNRGAYISTVTRGAPLREMTSNDEYWTSGTGGLRVHEGSGATASEPETYLNGDRKRNNG